MCLMCYVPVSSCTDTRRDVVGKSMTAGMFKIESEIRLKIVVDHVHFGKVPLSDNCRIKNFRR